MADVAITEESASAKPTGFFDVLLQAGVDIEVARDVVLRIASERYEAENEVVRRFAPETLKPYRFAEALRKHTGRLHALNAAYTGLIDSDCPMALGVHDFILDIIEDAERLEDIWQAKIAENKPAQRPAKPASESADNCAVETED
jgi:hypothetical protein